MRISDWSSDVCSSDLIINLGIGQPDFQTPEHVVEAAVKALRDGHHGYTPANGIPALREAVAEDLDLRHRVSVDPDCIVVVPGGKVTMFFAVLRSEEHTSELQSLMRISYAVFCLNKNNKKPSSTEQPTPWEQQCIKTPQYTTTTSSA